MKTGFIGLGGMGTGMARNVAQSGLLSGLYNRTAAKAQHLANELNVIAYEQPASLAADMDIVLICVSADDDLLGVVNAIAKALKPGSIVVDMSTVSCFTAKTAAALLAEYRVEFLDAPVSGGVEGAQSGTLAMMVAVPPKLWKKRGRFWNPCAPESLTWAPPALDKLPKRSIRSCAPALTKR